MGGAINGLERLDVGALLEGDVNFIQPLKKLFAVRGVHDEG
jgi:hypothetical protein